MRRTTSRSFRTWEETEAEEDEEEDEEEEQVVEVMMRVTWSYQTAGR